MKQLLADRHLSEKQINEQVDIMLSPWYRQFASLDPAPYLQRANLPILAINDELDVQVEAKMNLDAIRTALTQNKKSDIVERPKLNYLFQTVTTGAPSEYGSIDETNARLTPNTISDCIAKQTGVCVLRN